VEIEMLSIQAAIDAMIECALWSSTDDDGEPLDTAYDASDIDPGVIMALAMDLTGFIGANREDIEAADMTSESVGHDFWLTRNGHGAGFWDRGLGVIGERLTAAAKVYGTFDLYVGDDGTIYGG
jgi:hypothetical protein